MPQPMTANDMLSDLLARGLIQPAHGDQGFVMPSAYQSVPTMTTSGSLPVGRSASYDRDAELDQRATRDSDDQAVG